MAAAAGSEPDGVAVGAGPSPSGAQSAPVGLREVLAVRPFRRLLWVTALCSTGDWLALLALSGMATDLTAGLQAQSFALGGVVAIKLLPALVAAPLAGALADRFNRRWLMVGCDVLRWALLASVPIVGSLGWLFTVTLLIEICALFWIPAKDAAVPNLLRTGDDVDRGRLAGRLERANQLGLANAYALSVVLASLLFALITASGSVFGLGVSGMGALSAAFGVTSLGYLASAVIVARGIPELGERGGAGHAEAGSGASQQGVLSMLRGGLTFVAGDRMVRGLVLGVLGAFTAGGAVIASAKLYALSLGGGNATYGVLFAVVFTGMGLGMLITPALAARMDRPVLFAAAIVEAGAALCAVALAPDLWVALVAVLMVGAGAGVAFLNGLTIIGSEVADEIRGRTVAFVQALVRLVLLGSMAMVPVLVATVPGGQPTRGVLFGAGVVAMLVGGISWAHMRGRRRGPVPERV